MQLKPLTDTHMPSQRYASDGAITDKVCRRKCTREGSSYTYLLQNNQEGEHVALTVKINKRRCSFTYC